MRESFTYGSVGRAPRERCLYPEADRKKPRPLVRFKDRTEIII